jgi:ribose transport system ATP-binding protein
MLTSHVAATHTPGELALSARGIVKRFGTVEVLHGVDFELRRGEVHGLVGQNGAGKSTLVKILDGAVTADEGDIDMPSPAVEAGRRGKRQRRDIAMVFQEFSLIPSMSVAQNIVLDREPHTRLGLIDEREGKRRAEAALASVGAQIDPRLLVSDLRVGERQLVEIAKALSREASVLILDEPTASLSEREIADLMATIRRLVGSGISIVYISHHLEEVLAICDRVTVMRDGRIVLSAETTDLTVESVIDSMLGRSLEAVLEWQGTTADTGAAAALRVDGLRNRRLRGLSFEVRPGEVLGIAGLLGSGRSEIVRGLFGIDDIDAGTIRVDGRDVTVRRPSDAIEAGIMLVPEDRARSGLVAEQSVSHNMLMSAWSRFARRGLIDDGSARSVARRFVDQLAIKTPDIDERVRHLSGGNQQKVVVAKSLSVSPRVLLLDDPTVGIDVASKLDLLTRVRALASDGMAVILISSEFEELAGLADRILVLRDGAVVRLLDRSAGDDLSEEAISRAVQGSGVADAAATGRPPSTES